jgi:XTP/dITP diphosphohydrolase
MSRPPDGEALVLASRNVKKSREIADLLAPHGFRVVGVDDFPGVPEVVEDRDTFAGNAQKKAAETARRLERWVIADDSGLAVDALGGRPGVHSARYSGDAGGDREEQDNRNNAKLVAELAGVPPEKRTARYVCHVSVADPAGEIRLDVEATCGGRIVDQARGTNGFGYDPHFLVPEYHRTFGELSPLVKSHLSHRARALSRLVPRLVALLREPGSPAGGKDHGTSHGKAKGAS